MQGFDIDDAAMALRPSQRKVLADRLHQSVTPLRLCETGELEAPLHDERGRTFPNLGGSRLDLAPAVDYQAWAMPFLYTPEDTVEVRLARCQGLDALGARLGQASRRPIVAE